MGERNAVPLAFLKQNRAVKSMPCLRYPDPGAGLLHKRGDTSEKIGAWWTMLFVIPVISWTKSGITRFGLTKWQKEVES